MESKKEIISQIEDIPQFIEYILTSRKQKDYIYNVINTPHLPEIVFESNNGINPEEWIKWVNSISYTNEDENINKKEKLYNNTHVFFQLIDALADIDKNIKQSNRMNYSTIKYTEIIDREIKDYSIALIDKQIEDAKKALKTAIINAIPLSEYYTPSTTETQEEPEYSSENN